MKPFSAMRASVRIAAAIAWALGAGAAPGAVVYEVPEMKGEVVGAWDVNILADDVHFATPTLLSQVRIRLAIAGV